jgi:hypothetical protein
LRLRRRVLLSGAVLTLAGLGLVPLLPVSAVHKAVLALAWLVLSGRECRAFWRGYDGGGTLRIAADGKVRRQCRDGRWQRAELCPGSVVLPRIAWLRLNPPGMRPYAELVSADTQESEDWRRLQVIWRHIGAA